MLGGDKTTPLASLGLRNGDIIYLMSPLPSSSALVAAPAQTQEQGLDAAAMDVHEEGQVPHAEQEQHATTMEENDSFDDNADENQLEVGGEIPAFLLRVMQHNPGADGIVLNTHAALLEAGFRLPGTRNPYEIQTSASSSSVAKANYTLSKLPGIVCETSFSKLGGSIIVGASVGGSRTHHLAIKFSNYTLPYDRALWNLVKDGIAFPMMLAAYASARMPAPLGLIALPIELKTLILEKLSALDLAAIGSTCTEMHHLSNRDDFWQPLLETEFPAQPSWIAAATGRTSKWRFAQCYRDRKAREEEERRRRERRYTMRARTPYYGPRPPFHPQPAPPGLPPGVIGGDQDRFPFIPGHFIPAPGFGPSRIFFGGSGVRRQGGRGGGDFGIF